MENGKRQGERGGQRTDLAAGDGKLGPLAPGQRWTVARKREVVLRLLRGESAEMLSRELGVEIYRLCTAPSTLDTRLSSDRAQVRGL